MKQIVVIGAGISGLSIASILNSTLNQVTVLERKKAHGGLVYCDRVQDVLYHRVGGHVFNSKNSKVLEWFWSFFDKEQEFIGAKRNAKIWMNQTFVGYPLENYIHQLAPQLQDKIINELKNKPKNRLKDPLQYETFKSFLVDAFGEELFKNYFEPYNTKIWSTPLEQIPMSWLEGKLPMPDTEQILRNYQSPKEEKDMVHASFYYPKHGGSQFIADRLSSGLTINYNVQDFKIDVSSSNIKLNNQSIDALVYTGDIRQLKKYISGESSLLKQLLEDVSMLRSNGTSNYLCYCDQTDLSWLYIPEKEFSAHRIIFTGNFSPSNQPTLTDKSTCVVEFSGNVSKSDMEAELQKLPFHLEPIAFNYEPNSYVVHDQRTKQLIVDIKIELAKYSIYLLGRFAEWEYYNMDKAIEAAMLLSEELNRKY